MELIPTLRVKYFEKIFSKSANIIIIIIIIISSSSSSSSSSSGPGNSVGTETDYGLDDPGSNPGGDEIFHNGYRVSLGGKVRPRRAAEHSPPSSAAVMEE